MNESTYRIAILAACTAARLSLSALPPVYMDFGTIKGEAKASSEGHKDAIQIESWSFGASNPAAGNRVQGNRIGTDATGCTTGPLKFAVRGAAAEDVKKLCQSRVPLPAVTVDIDGVKHRLENASFTSCQSGDGTVPTDQFSLNFAKCTYHRGGVHVAAGDVNGDGAHEANARISGLKQAPVSVRLENLKFSPGGKSATMTLTKVGAGTLALASTNSTPLPQVVLELSNGTKWTFLEVTLTDLLISSATGGGSHATEQYTLNFARVEGPASGFAAR
jgi:type VI protein secretion system component Hcp